MVPSDDRNWQLEWLSGRIGASRHRNCSRRRRASARWVSFCMRCRRRYWSVHHARLVNRLHSPLSLLALRCVAAPLSSSTARLHWFPVLSPAFIAVWPDYMEPVLMQRATAAAAAAPVHHERPRPRHSPCSTRSDLWWRRRRRLRSHQASDAGDRCIGAASFDNEANQWRSRSPSDEWVPGQLLAFANIRQTSRSTCSANATESQSTCIWVMRPSRHIFALMQAPALHLYSVHYLSNDPLTSVSQNTEAK